VPELEPDRRRGRAQRSAARAGEASSGRRRRRGALGSSTRTRSTRLESGEERCRRDVRGAASKRARRARVRRRTSPRLARLSAKEDQAGSAEDRARSREHLERAAGLAPSRKDIQERLAQLRRLDASEKGFTTEPSQHFELAYDGARTDLVWSTADLTRILENAYQDLGELFGFWPVEAGRARIRVVVYGKSGFHEATGMGHWAVGAFDGSVRVPVEDLKKEKAALERVLRHEVTHYFVREAGGPSVPGWLNEGLAQWCESAYVVDRARDRRGEPGASREGAGTPQARRRPRPRPDGRADRGRLREASPCAGGSGEVFDFGERLLFELVAAAKNGGWRACFRRRTGVDPDTAVAELARRELKTDGLVRARPSVRTRAIRSRPRVPCPPAEQPASRRTRFQVMSGSRRSAGSSDEEHLSRRARAREGPTPAIARNVIREPLSVGKYPGSKNFFGAAMRDPAICFGFDLIRVEQRSVRPGNGIPESDRSWRPQAKRDFGWRTPAKSTRVATRRCLKSSGG
jgi:hypothetical protein